MDSHSFFGVILHDLKFVYSTATDSFTTDGATIYFNPYYLKDLSDFELDVCILHTLIHIALKHHLRYPKKNHDQLLHRACDIVVNSNLMSSLGLSNKEIMVQGRALPHLSPSGKEGITLTVEEVYSELLKTAQKSPNSPASDDDNLDDDIVTIDSFKATNVPIEKNRIFKINADVSTKMYLKDVVYEAYAPDEKDISWFVDVHKPIFDIDAYTFDNIAKYPSHTLVNYKIKLSKKMIGEPMPYPNYSKDHSLVGLVVNKPEEFSCQILSFIVNRESLAFFKSYKNNKDETYKTELNRYLSIPDKIRAHFDVLDQKLKFKKGNIDSLFKIRDYIATTFDYDIKYPKTPKGMDPILYFAEISKKGKCAHFATYMALMLRYYEIPSRLVGGYLFRTKAHADVHVYKENAHAWVEVYVPNLGWVTIDPTPIILTLSSGASNNDQFKELDSHTMWENSSKNDEERRLIEDELNKKLLEGYELSKQLKAGQIPSSIESIIHELKETKIDWRILINDFVQEDITDYSFMPPDTRFAYADFLLPSFSERDEKIKKILFMVDVSGSMSNEQINECFNEINGAIIQFNGKIEGHIGFFDATVKSVQPFDQNTDVLAIRPYGRGGTNFDAVFKYIEDNMIDDLPAKIVILSDGEANYPDEEKALGIPVLWIINNKKKTPPWGQVVRLE